MRSVHPQLGELVKFAVVNQKTQVPKYRHRPAWSDSAKRLLLRPELPCREAMRYPCDGLRFVELAAVDESVLKRFAEVVPLQELPDFKNGGIASPTCLPQLATSSEPAAVSVETTHPTAWDSLRQFFT